MSAWVVPVYASLGGFGEGLVLRVISGGWALRGERSLWTGRAARGRVTRAEAGQALYLVVALVVVAVFGWHWLHGVSGLFKVLAAVVWGVGALQSLWMLANLLFVGPARQRRTVYEVTNFRVIVSRGPRPADVTSVYLDQVGAPVVRRRSDGTGDVLLRTGGGQTQGSPLTRLFQSGGMGVETLNPVTALRAVTDAEQACEVIAEAQRRMGDAEEDAPPPLARLDDQSVPGEIALTRGEDVLWAGAPSRIPWWFSRSDLYLSAFALLWLAFVAGMGVLAVQSNTGAFFLIWIGLLALAGGVYPSVGRVVHRRLRIKRSRYLLTSRRLIATWPPLGSGAPVVVQAPLGALLPPALRGALLVTGPASPPGPSRRNGWRGLTWPASTVSTPVFVGLGDTQEVAGLIGDAQIALHAARRRDPHNA